MKRPWHKERLGQLLHHRKEFVTIDDLAVYRRPRVQLHAQGIVLRDEVPGALVKTKQQQVCRAGELLVAEIDAKVGGIGIVPDALGGAIVSSHYFLFEIDETKLDRRFLAAFVQTRTFLDQIEAQGSTNYAAIRPADVLRYEIPLPPIAEQRRVVARIEELAAKIHEAHTLRQQATAAAAALLSAKTDTLIDQASSASVTISALGSNGENPVQTGPFGAQLHASDFVPSGVPVLNVGNVWPDGLRLDRLDHVSPEKAAQLGRYSLNPGDLLFARSGATLGKVCLVPRKCNGWLMTGHLFRIRFDRSRVLPRFALAALRGGKSVQQQVFGKIRGATRPGYNTSLLGNIELPIPSLEQQARIVAQLEALEDEARTLGTLQGETAAELDALLPAVLDRAFKGEF